MYSVKYYIRADNIAEPSTSTVVAEYVTEQRQKPRTPRLVCAQDS